MLTIPAGPGSPDKGVRILLFGATKSGKTEIAVGVARLAPQRYLYIDNHGSTTAYPLHRYTDDEPYGMLPLVAEDCGRVITLLDEELIRASKGQHFYDAIVLDDITTHSYNESQRQERLFIARYRGKEAADERTLKRWGETLAANVAVLQRMVALANIYGISVWATCLATMGQDPEISQGREARPLAAGGIKDLLGGCFDLQIYVEQDVKDKTPKHVYHFIRDGAWQVGNRWEKAWLAHEHPATLANPSTEDILKLVQSAAQQTIEDFVAGG